ncbi:hypothetical protein JTB14_025323 [Gonioctena quinquepunctata]|nr:hypothetical protein JTB14_025323 [Gonioctena quinquepunctata]
MSRDQNDNAPTRFEGTHRYSLETDPLTIKVKDKHTFRIKIMEQKLTCVCGKRYKQKQSLDNHRNFNCGKRKTHTCRYCGIAYLAKRQLENHEGKCKKSK